MATYVIGDVQGCFDEFRRLLKQINFCDKTDALWFCGDLVNRGPKSLDVLRFVSDLKNSRIVLGNHDLHLLAVNQHPHFKNKLDTLEDILNASDREILCDWLRSQPLLHFDPELNYVMVHAGFPPQWDLTLAQQCAREVEKLLQGQQYGSFFLKMYGDEPQCWSENLTKEERCRFSVNCFTRLRFCDEEGNIHLNYKGPLGSQPANLMPWFEVSWRRSKSLRIVFGHWSALEGKVSVSNVFPLDTGCVWGGCLTALCLETGKFYQESCVSYARY